MRASSKILAPRRARHLLYSNRPTYLTAQCCKILFSSGINKVLGGDIFRQRNASGSSVSQLALLRSSLHSLSPVTWSTSRSFSTSNPYSHTRQGKKQPDDHSHSPSTPSDSSSQDPVKPNQPTEQDLPRWDQQKLEEEPSSSDSDKKQNEGDRTQSQKSDETSSPPPPHGDKTPWQVFIQTLSTEFKASKDWNEGTKALQSGYQDLAQNPTLQKARSAYEEASKTASSTTSAALKTTGVAIGKGASAVWESPVARVVRKGATVAGSGIEKATRPVRDTDVYKSVKHVIDDGSSSRYGGWVEKEERKQRRAQREAEYSKNGQTLQRREEDPEAGTSVTVHKDAAWKESWREFRQSSKLFQSLDSIKTVYSQSDNPLVSTARSWADTVGGFFAENETAMVIKRLREIDPTFQLEPFLVEMREYILPEVLDAYVKGDTATLKQWLSAAQYNVYAALMQQYTAAGLKSDGRILDIRHVDVANARLLEPGDIPVFVLTCRTQEVHVYRNQKTNQLAAGLDDKVQQVTYAIGVTRISEDVSNPETRGWRLIELQKSARDYY